MSIDLYGLMGHPFTTFNGIKIYRFIIKITTKTNITTMSHKQIRERRAPVKEDSSTSNLGPKQLTIKQKRDGQQTGGLCLGGVLTPGPADNPADTKPARGNISQVLSKLQQSDQQANERMKQIKYRFDKQDKDIQDLTKKVEGVQQTCEGIEKLLKQLLGAHQMDTDAHGGQTREEGQMMIDSTNPKPTYKESSSQKQNNPLYQMKDPASQNQQEPPQAQQLDLQKIQQDVSQQLKQSLPQQQNQSCFQAEELQANPEHQSQTNLVLQQEEVDHLDDNIPMSNTSNQPRGFTIQQPATTSITQLGYDNFSMAKAQVSRDMMVDIGQDVVYANQNSNHGTMLLAKDAQKLPPGPVLAEKVQKQIEIEHKQNAPVNSQSQAPQNNDLYEENKDHVATANHRVQAQPIQSEQSKHLPQKTDQSQSKSLLQQLRDSSKPEQTKLELKKSIKILAHHASISQLNGEGEGMHTVFVLFMVFKEFVEKAKPNTCKNYKSFFSKISKEFDVKELSIDPDEFLDAVQRIIDNATKEGKAYTQHTLENWSALTKSFFKDAYGYQFRHKRCLYQGGAQPAEREIMSLESFIEVYKKIHQQVQDEVDKEKKLNKNFKSKLQGLLYLIVLLETGCRGSAIRQAKFSDFYMKTNGDFMFKGLEPKTNKSVSRQLSEKCRQVLLMWKRERLSTKKRDTEKIECPATKKERDAFKLSYKKLRGMSDKELLEYNKSEHSDVFTIKTRPAAHIALKKLLEPYQGTHFDSFHPHDVRRIRAKYEAEKHGTKAAQMLLQHKDERTTKIYTGATKLDLGQLIETVDNRKQTQDGKSICKQRAAVNTSIRIQPLDNSEPLSLAHKETRVGRSMRNQNSFDGMKKQKADHKPQEQNQKQVGKRLSSQRASIENDTQTQQIYLKRKKQQ